MIYYFANEQAAAITVVRILHGARDIIGIEIEEPWMLESTHVKKICGIFARLLGEPLVGNDVWATQPGIGDKAL